LELPDVSKRLQQIDFGVVVVGGVGGFHLEKPIVSLRQHWQEIEKAEAVVSSWCKSVYRT
jgi:hypothetical protein